MTSFKELARKYQKKQSATLTDSIAAGLSLADEVSVDLGLISDNGLLDVASFGLPLFFIAGAADPVGPYGKGVYQAASAYKKAGMKHVTTKIYPLCRHEILNEINREEVYEDITQWITDNVNIKSVL